MLRGVDGRDDFDDAEGTARQPGRVSSIESRLRREPAESVQAPDIDRGRRVLVVEDERTIRHSISGYLQDAGYTVDEAENGAEALNRMRDAIPDVVVLDLLMPIMGGRAFVQACREDARLGAVPVVLLSAAHDLAQATEQLQPRASLAKPVDLDVLLAVVDRVSHS
ncbi:MAG TPA: response regulator [Chloroflexota bacterium]|jgi:CheY-like chemotaxis protein|nr:response regulator [Chloroflexota bacterium]